LFALGAAALPVAALAQGSGAWPDRPVSMVTGFAPGGANDLVTRLVAENLARRFGQPFVAENRPGAGARVAAAHVARARPDGHTFLTGTPGILVLNPLLYSNLDYRPAEFTPVSLVGGVPYVLIVRRELPVSSVAELIAYAKARPGVLNHGSTGTGPVFVQHLFKLRTDTRFEDIVYSGTAPA
jgi:tripartite-type tricarboxylate transporter receptor subunit TctC